MKKNRHLGRERNHNSYTNKDYCALILIGYIDPVNSVTFAFVQSIFSKANSTKYHRLVYLAVRVI